jgi:hypothetical protein
MIETELARRYWLEGARYGWDASGEGWNSEIAESHPERTPDFETECPYGVSLLGTPTNNT